MDHSEDMKIKIADVEFKNPIWVASGTFGSGLEFVDFLKVENIGAIVTKTITLSPRIGNNSPRVVETSAGLLNSIGLENNGAEYFKKEIVPKLKKIGTKIIVSVAGDTEGDILSCIELIEEETFPAAIELNLSCPNVVHGNAKYKLISQDPESTEKIIRKVKGMSKRPIIAKLTPNVTDIAEIALAAESAGADALSLVNTYMGMAIDPFTRKPLLGKVIGGLSGPAIKPLALRAVWEVYNKILIPIIGIGGIMTGKDVAEFMIAGATCIQIGTANLVSPDAAEKILEEFEGYVGQNNISNIKELIGTLII